MREGRQEKVAEMQTNGKEQKKAIVGEEKKTVDEKKPTMGEIWKNTFASSKLAESSSLSSSDEDEDHDEQQSSSSASSSSSEGETSPQKRNKEALPSEDYFSPKKEIMSVTEREHDVLDESGVAEVEEKEVEEKVEVEEMVGVEEKVEVEENWNYGEDLKEAVAEEVLVERGNERLGDKIRKAEEEYCQLEERLAVMKMEKQMENIFLFQF